MHSFQSAVMPTIVIAAIAVFVAVVMPTTLHAELQDDEISKSCDTGMYKALAYKGYLEAKRETEIAQRLILKPDSILEYSCFKDTITNAWPFKASIFSSYGGGKDIPKTSLDTAIKSAITPSLGTYLQNNYGHLYLGGTSAFSKDGGAGGSGVCNPMYWVWHVSKCGNAGFSAAGVGNEVSVFHFFRLSNLATNDYRQYPYSCSDTAERTNKIKTAQQYLDDFANPAKSGTVDDATDFKNNLSYTKRLQQCGDPVPTGVSFYWKDSPSTVVKDHACITPGCVFDGNSSCTHNPPASQ